MNGGRPFRLFLSGFLACGKTTVGRVLARDLRLPFMDLDETLVVAEGMPILEMMDARGEPWFRRRERTLLEGLAHSGSLIVATGSGTPAMAENLALIGRLGEMVFLNAPWDAIAARLQGKRSVLPPDLDVETLYGIYLKRLPYYRRARWILAPEAGETPEALALRIRLMIKDVLPCAI
jgi:shikimate kinase